MLARELQTAQKTGATKGQEGCFPSLVQWFDASGLLSASPAKPTFSPAHRRCLNARLRAGRLTRYLLWLCGRRGRERETERQSHFGSSLGNWGARGELRYAPADGYMENVEEPSTYFCPKIQLTAGPLHSTHKATPSCFETGAEFIKARFCKTTVVQSKVWLENQAPWSRLGAVEAGATGSVRWRQR